MSTTVKILLGVLVAAAAFFVVKTIVLNSILNKYGKFIWRSSLGNDTDLSAYIRESNGTIYRKDGTFARFISPNVLGVFDPNNPAAHVYTLTLTDKKI